MTDQKKEDTCRLLFSSKAAKHFGYCIAEVKDAAGNAQTVNYTALESAGYNNYNWDDACVVWEGPRNDQKYIVGDAIHKARMMQVVKERKARFGP